MGQYLNRDNTGFIEAKNGIFVDKTECVSLLNKFINTKNKYICVSRPRRFGKSMMTSLMNAYYSKGCDSKSLFDNLSISKDQSYGKHLNQHHVIWFDLQYEIIKYKGSVNDIVDVISNNIIKELEIEFNIQLANTTLADALQSIYSKFNQQFIVIIDEWDAIFREHSHDLALEKAYIDFLRGLFKGETGPTDTIALAYITGILPIKRYNSESALNNFDEYTMLDSEPFSQFFGFTESETKNLCNEYQLDFELVKQWYDGYMVGPYHMLNPKSVVTSIIKRNYRSYWSKTGAYEAVSNLIDDNFLGLKDDLIQLLSGGSLKLIDTSSFNNDVNAIETKDDAITYLVHLGYLSFNSETKEIFIPNQEVRLAISEAVRKSKKSGLSVLMAESKQLLQDTLNGECDKVASAIEKCHNLRISSIKYNDENSLALVVCYAYIATADFYLPFIREFPSGKGFADIVLIPDSEHIKSLPAIVIELKYNKTANAAIEQIKAKQYSDYLSNFAGKILLVGINYDPNTKEHTCIIEQVEKV